MTHDELVERARRWVKSRRYPVVLADVRTTITSEQPDVIGFRTGGDTMLVECKASRADFLRDRKKRFRREPSAGMGYFRWFFLAPAIGRIDDVPEGWGVASPQGRKVVILRTAQPFRERSIADESRLLVRAVRCVTEGWGLRMFGPNAPRCACGHAMHNGRRCGELITHGPTRPDVFGTSVASCGCKGMPFVAPSRQARSVNQTRGES